MNTVTEMPMYQSHKKVRALKIKKIREVDVGDGSMFQREIVPEEEGYAPIAMSRDYWHKHQPYAGGYYVVYEDGYKSFSPAEAFEEGYTRIQGERVEQFKVGDNVKLKGNHKYDEPQMTIDVLGETVNNHNWVDCKWFEGRILHSGRFAAEALRKVQ